jgi:hypothetical protein
MTQNDTARQNLLNSFKEAVRAPNEIDFCALVKLDAPVPEQAVLEYFAADNLHGREVNTEWVKKIVSIYHQLYNEQKFSKFRFERNNDNIVAWLPVWLPGDDDETRKYGGKFILYKSSTPQGEHVFNAGIQVNGKLHIRLAKEYLDNLRSESE